MVYGVWVLVMVGLGVMLVVFVVGGVLGVLVGFYGSWIDVVVLWVIDVFFGLLLLLVVIVFM